MRGLYISTWLTQRATLGCQIALVDGDRILLVRHSYKTGWHLPGGRVDPPEDPGLGAARELYEETGYKIRSTPALLAFLPNQTNLSRRDYVAIYTASSYESPSYRHKRSFEIEELVWFKMSELPPDVDYLARYAAERGNPPRE